MFIPVALSEYRQEKAGQSARRGMIEMKRIGRRTSSVVIASACVATVATSLAFLSASPASASPASVELTDCRSDPAGSLSGKLRIHNLDTIKMHSYTVNVVWNKGSDRLGSLSAWEANIEPGQTQVFDISTSTPSATVGEMPAGPVSCSVESMVDENNETAGS
jgi:hypothetical protein